MNEQTTKLIEQLAQQLGTTSEYLWSILLKQAPIDSTTSLIQVLCVIVYGIILWKIHLKLSKPVTDGEWSIDFYYKYDVYIPLMIVAVCIFISLVIVCFLNVGDIANGFFNPEYWALNRVLNLIH